jgi:hypothetical protein
MTTRMAIVRENHAANPPTRPTIAITPVAMKKLLSVMSHSTTESSVPTAPTALSAMARARHQATPAAYGRGRGTAPTGAGTTPCSRRHQGKTRSCESPGAP